MFYPEYVDMETEVLGVMMEAELKKFLDEELPCHVIAAISSLCKKFSFIESTPNASLSLQQGLSLSYTGCTLHSFY